MTQRELKQHQAGRMLLLYLNESWKKPWKAHDYLLSIAAAPNFAAPHRGARHAGTVVAKKTQARENAGALAYSTLGKTEDFEWL